MCRAGLTIYGTLGRQNVRQEKEEPMKVGKQLNDEKGFKKQNGWHIDILFGGGVSQMKAYGYLNTARTVRHENRNAIFM